METNFSKALTFTVTNSSQNSSQNSSHITFTVPFFFKKGNSQVNSPPFSSGGCEWIVDLRGRCATNYLSLYLSVNEPKSLGLNWKRKVSFYFVLLNQSGQETTRRKWSDHVSFSAGTSSSWGWEKAFPLEKILDKGVLVNDRFTIEIYIKVIEVVDGNAYVNGFNVLSSQVPSVKKIFKEHPDIAKGFKSKNEVVKTEYMNVLLSLLETVKKPPKSITKTEFSKAQSGLCELTEVGFRLEWLKIKLEEIALANTEVFQIQQLEEQVKKLELKTVKVLSLEKELSDLKTELANEKAKSANYVSLKEAFSDLRVELEKEKAKSTSAAAKVLSLKKTLSDLKVEQDQKKAKSTKVFSWFGLKVKEGNSEITDNLLSW